MREWIFSDRGLPRARKREFPLIECRDCGHRSDEFMVHDRVWHDAFGTHGGKRAQGALCFECLEERLGRRLTLADFRPEVPANRAIFFGAMVAGADPPKERHDREHAAEPQEYGNALWCEHANEMPVVCPCKRDCYCRRPDGPCRGRPVAP